MGTYGRIVESAETATAMTNTAARDVDWPKWDDPRFYRQDPGAMHAQMAAQREAAPVHWYEAPGLASGFWVLSKWQDCRFVGGNPALFCSRYGFAVADASEPSGALLHQLPGWAREELAKPGLTPAQKRALVTRGKLSLGDPELENMIFLDPPRHGAARRIFMKSLRPSLVRSMKARFGEIADEVISEMIKPGEEIDFVATIGRIPAIVMTEMVGVPRDMREEFIAMAAAHLEAKGVTITADKDPAEIERVQRLAEQFRDYVDELLAERRNQPAGDENLISAIVRSELDGGPVPRSLALVFITHFHGETTSTLLSHIAMLLGMRDDQRRLLLQRPELLENAIEETMRYHPINWSGCRTATREVSVRGQTIKKDDYVVMAYASANRDPDVYEQPDRYDIARSFDNDHLGFGYGEHSCPGALLVRVESLAIWERLLARFSDWQLVGEPVTWSNTLVRGVRSLPVRFRA
jgi:cytochrome P450